MTSATSRMSLPSSACRHSVARKPTYGRARVARIGRLRDAQSRLLAARAAALLGPERPDRRTRVMVTLPDESATDSHLVRDLVERGMDIARINAAHGDPDTWRAMARRVRSASHRGRPCPILLDLPGPKLRIAALPSKPGHLRLRSPRDGTGPNLLLLDGSGAPGMSRTSDGTHPRVAVDPAWLTGVEAGDRIECVDARGRPRTLRVEARTSAQAVTVSTHQGIALAEGSQLRLERKHGDAALLSASSAGPYRSDTCAGAAHALRRSPWRAHLVTNGRP